MLFGTQRARHFLAFLSHFSKIIFEKRLFRQFQRFALPASGRAWIMFEMWKKLKAGKMLAVGAAESPPSTARCVGLSA
jgi:hypothetical protein